LNEIAAAGNDAQKREIASCLAMTWNKEIVSCLAMTAKARSNHFYCNEGANVDSSLRENPCWRCFYYARSFEGVFVAIF